MGEGEGAEYLKNSGYSPGCVEKQRDLGKVCVRGGPFEGGGGGGNLL